MSFRLSLLTRNWNSYQWLLKSNHSYRWASPVYINCPVFHFKSSTSGRGQIQTHHVQPSNSDSDVNVIATRTMPSKMTFGRPPQYVDAWLKDFATGNPLNLISLERSVFCGTIRKDIMHRVVVYQLAKKRGVVVRNQKSRWEVRGSRRKVRPQKGMGMARVGDRYSPLFRGGGRAFPRKTRDFSLQIQQKVVDLGIRSALASRFCANQMHVVDGFSWTSDSVDLKSMLGSLLQSEGHVFIEQKVKILFVHDADEDVKQLADAIQKFTAGLSPNSTLEGRSPFTLQNVSELNVYDVLNHHHVILSKKVVPQLESRYALK